MKQMRVNVGTKNKVKIGAVKKIVNQYPLFSKVRITSQNIDSEVSEQPKTLKETIEGAKNRAKKSFNNCDYSFGIESGLMKIEGQFFDITAVSIYNGKRYALGFSSSWQCPQKISEVIFKKKVNMTQAANLCGLSKKKNVGSQEGVVGVLTKNRVTRQDYTEQALYMALIQIENNNLY